MKALKLWNGGDWDGNGGHLFIAAHSVKDCVELVNLAYRKLNGYESRTDIRVCSMNEVNTYYHKGCWGDGMDNVIPECGVWWAKSNGFGGHGKPERVI